MNLEFGSSINIKSLCATTLISGTTAYGSTLVCGATVCGVTLLKGTTICGTTTAKAPILSATTCSIAPIVCASTCFVGSGAGLTGTAASLTANNATCLGTLPVNCFACVVCPNNFLHSSNEITIICDNTPLSTLWLNYRGNTGGITTYNIGNGKNTGGVASICVGNLYASGDTCGKKICATTCFIGSGAGLTGTASSLTVGTATNASNIAWSGVNSKPDVAFWRTTNANDVVVGQLGWMSYGDGGTIFDASCGIAPDNSTVIDNSTPINAVWQAGYPVLMGWDCNLGTTYAVKVQCSCHSTTATNAGTATSAGFATCADCSNTTFCVGTNLLMTTGAARYMCFTTASSTTGYALCTVGQTGAAGSTGGAVVVVAGTGVVSSSSAIVGGITSICGGLGCNTGSGTGTGGAIILCGGCGCTSGGGTATGGAVCIVGGTALGASPTCGNVYLMHGTSYALCAISAGAVTLFYNNASKLATNNTGAAVTGCLTATVNVCAATCVCAPTVFGSTLVCGATVCGTTCVGGGLVTICNTNAKLCMIDSAAPNLTLGLASEVGGQLIDYGTNFTQLGGKNNTYQGGYFRIDTRNAYTAEFFNIKYVPIGGGTDQTPYKMSTGGTITNTGSFCLGDDLVLATGGARNICFDATASGAGSGLLIQGNTGGASSAGGSLTITAGAGGTTTAAGGALNLNGGNATGAAASGDVDIRGGSVSSASGTGGHVYIRGGAANSVASGNVYIMGFGENMITALANAGVTLYYDNSTKLATTTAGITVSGNIAFPNNVADRIIGFSGSTSGTGNNLTICAGASSNIGGNVIVCAGAGGAAGGVVCLVGGASQGNNSVRIYDGASLRFGTTTIGACVTGIFCATTCGTSPDWVATSDCRVKTDITPISNALSMVMELQGVCYHLCDDCNCENHVGLIAQDVQKILPEIVAHGIPTEEDAKYGITDDKLGLKYDKLTAVLIEAIKEQQLQINCLQDELNYLKFNKV